MLDLPLSPELSLSLYLLYLLLDLPLSLYLLNLLYRCSRHRIYLIYHQYHGLILHF